MTEVAAVRLTPARRLVLKRLAAGEHLFAALTSRCFYRWSHPFSGVEQNPTTMRFLFSNGLGDWTARAHGAEIVLTELGREALENRADDKGL